MLDETQTPTNEGQSGGDGKSIPEWMSDASPESLADLAKEFPDYIKTAQNFKDKIGPLKSYLNAQKKISQKGVILPGENATDEEMNAFYEAIGRPKSPDDYEFKPPENMPQNIGFNEQKAKAFADLFYQAGVPKPAAKKIFDAYNEMVIAEAAETEKAVKEFQGKSVADLKKELGSNFDKTIKNAQAVAKVFGGREFIDFAKATGMDYHPIMVKFLAKIGSRFGEHELVDGHVEPLGEKPITRTQLEQMMKDKRYSGREYERDPEYIQKISDGWKRLTAGEAAAGR